MNAYAFDTIASEPTTFCSPCPRLVFATNPDN